MPLVYNHIFLLVYLLSLKPLTYNENQDTSSACHVNMEIQLLIIGILMYLDS